MEEPSEHAAPDEADDSDDWVEYEPFRGEALYTCEDYEAAYLLRADHQGSPRALRVFLAGCLVLAGLGAIATTSVGAWTLLLVVLLVAMVVARRQHGWMGRAVFLSRPPRSKGTVELTIDHEAVRRRAPTWETEYRWKLVTGWLESASHFVLLGPRGITDVLPKRAFSEARWPELRELLEDCVEPGPTAPTAAERPRSRGTLLAFALGLIVVCVAFLVNVR